MPSTVQPRGGGLGPHLLWHVSETVCIHCGACCKLANPARAQSSKETKSRSCGFGSGDRFSEVKSNNARHLKVLSPGPGEYTV
eukprot:364208-Chlamydomonas_euryale.AAC.36